MAGKILMIVAPERFRDEELFVPKEYFEGKGIKVEVASTRKGDCKGVLGGVAESSLTLGEVDVGEYDAVVFVGGGGTPVIRKEERALEIARETVDAKRVLAAICWAPTILAKAGVLKGKKATVWVGADAEYGKKTSEVLEDFGAQYSEEGCVVDGRIVTADGPATAKRMAAEIVKLLG
ncbi:DJ-1/PfpI family protein [Candidatus Micrarchaeota archaeon]|nr:DJ-1/PfpI family protein [Candidatus Micrarchaeota archaeon]